MRIKRTDIDFKVAELNELLDRPTKHYDPESRLYGIGHFHIYKTHFGYELHETTSQTGAVRSINAGGLTSRSFYDFLCSLLTGVRLCKPTDKSASCENCSCSSPRSCG
jgi:hypothetical protein